MVFSAGNFGELIREGRGGITVPLDVRAVMRSMDADGVPGMGLARSLCVSRDNAVKHAVKENIPLTPSPPIERPRSVPGATSPGLNTWRRRARSPCAADVIRPRASSTGASPSELRGILRNRLQARTRSVARGAAGFDSVYLELEWSIGTHLVGHGIFRADAADENHGP